MTNDLIGVPSIIGVLWLTGGFDEAYARSGWPCNGALTTSRRASDAARRPSIVQATGR
ncbi:hypothetical protein ACN22W_24225 [Burkholderia theae]|uniref:hypothetical protein n=1 Tax=Burkholderia theae TaxID=3143496 RepID=UPI003AFA6A9E